jgi:hypothetical protein
VTTACLERRKIAAERVPSGAYRSEALPLQKMRPDIHRVIFSTGRLWQDYRRIMIW